MTLLQNLKTCGKGGLTSLAARAINRHLTQGNEG
jgi:hypothetical protein